MVERERGREGGREGEREGGREGEREGGREGKSLQNLGVKFMLVTLLALKR